MFRKIIASFVCVAFIASTYQPVAASEFSISQLPTPGTMVGLSSPFAPLALKGIVVDLQKPLEFQFIVDTGKGPQDTTAIKEEANRLVKYFLAGLTIPEGDLWVNLSPYEKDRMVPDALGQTDLGRDLLAQDYILKQLTASLIYPEKDLGKEFWAKVYKKAQEQFGTTNIPVNTFNKVWILPDQAQVFENKNAAYVTKSTLKVMLDEDYLALEKGLSSPKVSIGDPGRGNSKDVNSLGSQIVREIILPEIEKEVNTGTNFAPLRQIYQALILAKWYKETVKNGLLEAVYIDQKKTAGVNLGDPAVKEQIYERYLQAYKKGVFNYIKEDPMPDGQSVPRKYFSGGITKLEPDKIDRSGRQADVKGDGAMISLRVVLLTAVLAAGIQIGAFAQDPGVFNSRLSEREEWDSLQRKGIQGEQQKLMAGLNVFSDRRLETINKLIAMPQYYPESLAPLARALYGEWIAGDHGGLRDNTNYNPQDKFYIGKRINFLSNRFDKKAIPYLVANLRNENDYISSGSSLALGFMGKDAREAIPALIEFIRTENGRTSDYSPGPRAIIALEQIITDIQQSTNLPLDFELLKQTEAVLVQRWESRLDQESEHFVNPENIIILKVLVKLGMSSNDSVSLLRNALRYGNFDTRSLATSIFVKTGRYSNTDIPLIIDGLSFSLEVRRYPLAGNANASSNAKELIRLVDETGSLPEGLALGLGHENPEVRNLTRTIIDIIKPQDVLQVDSVNSLVEMWGNRNENIRVEVENFIRDGYLQSATKYISDKLDKSFDDVDFIQKNGNYMVLLQRINPDEFSKLETRIFKEKKWPVIRNWSIGAGGLLALLAGLGFAVKKLRGGESNDSAMLGQRPPSQDAAMIISEDGISQYLRTDRPSPDQFEEWLHQAASSGASEVSYTRHDLEVVEDLSGINMYNRYGTKISSEEYLHESDIEDLITFIVHLENGQKIGVVFDSAMLGQMPSHLSEAELALLREPDEAQGFYSKRARNDERIKKQVIQIEESLGRARSEAETKAAQIIGDLDAKKVKFKGEEIHVLNGIDAKAKVIGRVDRNIAEAYGYIHETANIVVLTPDGKRVVTQLRNKTNYDDHLAMFGGHLTVGEYQENAAVDELKQEMGFAEDDKLDSKAVFVDTESYDLQGDPNRERRSWFIYRLSEREWKLMEEKRAIVEKVFGISEVTPWSEYKAALFDAQDGIVKEKNFSNIGLGAGAVDVLTRLGYLQGPVVSASGETIFELGKKKATLKDLTTSFTEVEAQLILQVLGVFRNGSGEVVGNYLYSFDKIDDAKKATYQHKGDDPSRFDGQQVRVLKLEGEASPGAPDVVPLTPDSLDHLFSSGGLWNKIKTKAIGPWKGVLKPGYTVRSEPVRIAHNYDPGLPSEYPEYYDPQSKPVSLEEALSHYEYVDSAMLGQRPPSQDAAMNVPALKKLAALKEDWGKPEHNIRTSLRDEVLAALHELNTMAGKIVLQKGVTPEMIDQVAEWASFDTGSGSDHHEEYVRDEAVSILDKIATDPDSQLRAALVVLGNTSDPVITAWVDKKFATSPREKAITLLRTKLSLPGLVSKAAKEALKKLGVDQAMLQTPTHQTTKDKAALAKDLGGIDLNQINVNREGKAVVVQFDPAQLNQLMQGGFEGFMPVIINITPIQSPLPLLGIAPMREQESLAKG